MKLFLPGNYCALIISQDMPGDRCAIQAPKSVEEWRVHHTVLLCVTLFNLE